MEHNIIQFYRHRDDYGFFSNFAPYPIEIDGTSWPTNEHYFQAQKFLSPELQEHIRAAKMPHDAARMGRSFSPIREDWEMIKDDIMRSAVKAKFSQHRKLKRLLLATEGHQLVEHTSNDIYWADGGDGSGKNMLGQLLMELRAELISHDNETL